MNFKSAYAVLLSGLLLALLLNCKNETIKTAPTLTGSVVTNITATSAISGGEITSDGGTTITARGFCWSTNQNPTIADNKTTTGIGSGSFTSSLTGLAANTTYYLRAYAINGAGTAYGNEVSFKTLGNLITIHKALVLGNSMTKHAITSFWWGNWGMAATERSKDFVHLLEKNFKTRYPAAVINSLSLLLWEKDHSTYNKGLLDPVLTTDIDLIIIKIGENANITTNYDTDFAALIDYIRAKLPNCQIIVGGEFWTNITKDTMMKSVCEARGIKFVDFSFMWNDLKYQSTLSTSVYGDDLVWHKISDGGETAPGVARHPCDLGMQVMAEKFAEALGY